MAMMTKLMVVLYVVLTLQLKPNDHHHASSDCCVGYGCIRTETWTSSSSSTEIRSRKLLLHNYNNADSEEVFKSFGPILDHQQQQQGGHDGGNVDDWSLRAVPSGPDPLHHNGSGPKKPRTP